MHIPDQAQNTELLTRKIRNYLLKVLPIKPSDSHSIACKIHEMNTHQPSLRTTVSRTIGRIGRHPLARRCTAAILACEVATAALPIRAQSTQFALVCLGTETGYTINFSARWGNSGAWTKQSVAPGKWKAFTWKYDYPGENRSPKLNIRYDDDLTNRSNFVNTPLDAYAASYNNCEEQGKTYNFYTRGEELYIQAED